MYEGTLEAMLLNWAAIWARRERMEYEADVRDRRGTTLESINTVNANSTIRDKICSEDN